MYKTKEASQIVGVSKRTLQYYDELGLLKVTRDQSGSRIYDNESLKEIYKIMLLKEMGFSLKEIKKMIQSSNESYISFYDPKIAEIKEEIQERELNIYLLQYVKENEAILSQKPTKGNYMDAIKSLMKTIERRNKNE